MKKAVKTAVIPAAGFGTRFLPFTKTIPKAFIPILTTPIIQYRIECISKEGIENIIIVIDKQSQLLKQYFTKTSAEIIKHLKEKNKSDLIKAIKNIPKLANIKFVLQTGAYGNGTPMLNAEKFIGNEPFLYMWSDSFVHCGKGKSAIRQLIDTYEKYGCTVLSSLKRAQRTDYDQFGYISGNKITRGIIDVDGIIEKPGKENAPSSDATLGECLFTPDIYKYMRKANKTLNPNEELHYIKALELMVKDGKKVLAKRIQNGQYYDIGNKLDFLKTQVEFGLRDTIHGKDFEKYLTKLIKERNKRKGGSPNLV